ncbi:MAG: PIN domain-containing protein [Bryobacterales bacterium]|nr:PIN domain-containing protein [Bryobacterales bacterium]
MKPCLVDVNLWLALVVRQHEHHARAGHWFDSLPASGAGLCRFVQLALIRLLANRSLMGAHAIAVSAGWDLVAELMEDERVEFLPEPPGLDGVMPALLRYRAPTVQLVRDSYLAAFAIAQGLTLVTLDQGFRQFRGLDVKLL